MGVLEDLLSENLPLVICGTGAGHKSAERRQYYAGPGNRFWGTLAETGLTPRRLSPAEYELLLTHGIGLTDLVKHRAGSDHELGFRSEDRDLLRNRLLVYRPRYVCFNGKRAAKEFFGTKKVAYGLQSAVIGTSLLFVAPSTSGAARAAWDIAPWRELASLVRRHRPA